MRSRVTTSRARHSSAATTKRRWRATSTAFSLGWPSGTLLLCAQSSPRPLTARIEATQPGRIPAHGGHPKTPPFIAAHRDPTHTAGMPGSIDILLEADHHPALGPSAARPRRTSALGAVVALAIARAIAAHPPVPGPLRARYRQGRGASRRRLPRRAAVAAQVQVPAVGGAASRASAPEIRRCAPHALTTTRGCDRPRGVRGPAGEAGTVPARHQRGATCGGAGSSLRLLSKLIILACSPSRCPHTPCFLCQYPSASDGY